MASGTLRPVLVLPVSFESDRQRQPAFDIFVFAPHLPRCWPRARNTAGTMRSPSGTRTLPGGDESFACSLLICELVPHPCCYRLLYDAQPIPRAPDCPNESARTCQTEHAATDPRFCFAHVHAPTSPAHSKERPVAYSQ